MNLKPVAAIGLMAVGVGAVAWTVLGLGSASAGAATTYRTATATTTDVQETAAASGNLVAASIYDLSFGVTPEAASGTDSAASAASASSSASSTSSSASSDATGATASGGSTSVDVRWPVTEVNVEVGDLVKAGDVLAVADASTAQLAVDLAAAQVEAAKAQRKDDRRGGTASERAQAKDQLRSARTSLSNARASYSSTVAQNNLKLAQATSAVNDARRQYANDKAAGAASPVLAQDKAAVENAQNSLASAKLQAQAGNREAANQVTSASQSVVSAQRGYDDATTSADSVTLVADDVSLKNARQALRDAKAALAAATITAPIDGRVTAVDATVGEDSSATAIELQSTRLALSVSVAEDDILSLAVGQPATVAISATGDTAAGTVTSVDPVATTSGTSGVVSYTVVVTLDDTADTASTGTDDTTGPGAATPTGSGDRTAGATDPATEVAATPTALPGMSAELTIVIDQAADTVAVPAIALSGTAASGYTVRVLGADGSVETRNVEVGLVTSDLAQITSGIADGETVVTGTAADRTATSTGTGTTGTGRNGFGGAGGLSGAGGFQPPAGGFQP